MTSSDFDHVPDRRGTGSLKWDVPAGELAMWVADMDFPAAEPIRRAMQRRLDHGVFGYTVVPEEWYEAYRRHWQLRHGLAIERDSLIFCTGVVPAISSMVRKLTTVGENVLIQTPVYNIFFNSIRNNGRVILESPLMYDGEGYSVDFADLEEKLALPQTTLMILCNPHNPVGKLWDRATLARIGELCQKHHVLVISDEIHCDLTLPGTAYVPFADVSPACRDNSVTCLSPSKCFNIAGLQTAAVMVPNPTLRHKVWRGLNTDEVAEPNVFAITAAVAALTEGEEWLTQLCEYLHKNRLYAGEFLRAELPEVRLVAAEATYLLWLDCRAVTTDTARLAQHLRASAGLYVTEGNEYGESGRGFLRMNAACPLATLREGLRRLRDGVRSYQEEES